jgi:hypothetical protein
MTFHSNKQCELDPLFEKNEFFIDEYKKSSLMY